MLKILIVDDEFYFREALKISLPWKELGFELCGEAKNGKDALDKVEVLKPEIIIVDINMPIMDGLAFVKNIMGVGSEKNELFNISESYKESIVALKNKLTLGKNKVIFYSSVAGICRKENLFYVENRSQLLMNMRIVDDKEVQKLITQIFERIRRYNIHYELLFVVCIEMISVCLEFIVEVGLSINDILPNNKRNIIEEIQSKRSIDEMEDWITEIYQYTLDTAKRNKSLKASKLIDEVKKYIKENYQNSDLSINEIAKNLYVNYAHLCCVFKRDWGTTINEYLTEFRIQKAKELFDAGNYLIHNVAGRVGYCDANYFAKCFKKYYGLTPSK